MVCLSLCQPVCHTQTEAQQQAWVHVAQSRGARGRGGGQAKFSLQTSGHVILFASPLAQAEAQNIATWVETTENNLQAPLSTTTRTDGVSVLSERHPTRKLVLFPIVAYAVVIKDQVTNRTELMGNIIRVFKFNPNIYLRPVIILIVLKNITEMH